MEPANVPTRIDIYTDGTAGGFNGGGDSYSPAAWSFVVIAEKEAHRWLLGYGARTISASCIYPPSLLFAFAEFGVAISAAARCMQHADIHNAYVTIHADNMEVVRGASLGALKGHLLGLKRTLDGLAQVSEEPRGMSWLTPLPDSLPWTVCLSIQTFNGGSNWIGHGTLGQFRGCGHIFSVPSSACSIRLRIECRCRQP
eukprot:5891329-Pyramimonas_sp.AAC.1